MFALFCVPWAANAQTVTIGEGSTTQNSAPIANYYNYSMAEMIFTADEIGFTDANTILSLAFQCTTSVNKNYEVTIYMKNISAGEFTDASEFVTLSAADVVFTGTVTPTAGWTLIELPTPFTYDNTGNLLIAVNKTGGGYSGNASIWKYTSTSSTYKMLYKQNDGSAYDPTTSLTLDLNYNRPNVQLTFGTPPSCPKPTLNPAENVDSQNASLSWTENGTANSWVIQYGTSDDFADATTVNRNGIPLYAISDLNPQTTYYVRMKSVCGDGDESNWSDVISFTTACASISSFPWNENFNSLTAGIPQCWDNSEGTSSATNRWNYYATGHDGACLRFNSYSNTLDNTSFLKTPVFNLPGSVMQLVFWYKNPAGGDYSVYLSTDGGETYTDNVLATGLSGTEWAQMEINLDNYVGRQNVVIVFKGTSNYGNGDAYLYLDDVTLRLKPSCASPTDLTVDNITTGTAELGWTANSGEQAWTVYYKKITEEEYNSVPADANPFTLEGLTPASNYVFYVVANCSETEQSYESATFSFTTECGAIDALGYSENFDGITGDNNYTPTANVLPNCWSYINESTSSSYMYFPVVSSYSTSYANSTPNGLKFYAYGSTSSDEYAILPEMENLAGKQISMQAKGYSATSVFKVGLMTNPTDASTFVEITNGANPAISSSSFQEYTFIVPADATASHIAIMMEAPTGYNSLGIYIDDITITEAPSCLKPSDLTATLIPGDGTKATLAWTENGEATAWQIMLNDNENELIEADVNPFTLENLTPETIYTAKVRANCGGSDGVSEWCNVAVTFEPTDKIVIGDGAATSSYVPTQTNYNYSFTQQIYTVEELGAAGFIESIDFFMTGTSDYTRNLDIYMVSTEKNAFESNTDWIAVTSEDLVYSGNVNFTAGSWTSIALDESFLYDGTQNVAIVVDDNTGSYSSRSFKAFSTTGTQALYKYQDGSDIPVTYTQSGTLYSSKNQIRILKSELGDCVKPVQFAASEVASYSVELGWNELGASEEWVIYYYEDQDVHTVTVTENPYTLEGLNPATDYSAFVIPSCGIVDNDPNSSLMSNFIEFTTLAACPTPTNVTTSDITAHTVTLNWETNADSWQVMLNDNEEELIAADVKPYTLTGLAPETEFSVKVRSVCGDVYGEWSEAVSFTTGIACPAPTDLDVAENSLSGYTATLEWEGTSESYIVSYRTKAYMNGIDEEFDNTSIPSGWENKAGLLSNVMGGTALTSGSKWSFNTGNGVFDNHAKINIYGTSCYGWLISPAFTVEADHADLTFDLALTAYSGSNVPAPATTGTDDKFVVLISADNEATWTILRKWSNEDGAEYVYNNIANAAEGEQVRLDLREYAGQSVRIAFYGESTASNADNNLHIDNVYVGVSVAAGDWQTVVVTDTTAELTDLEPETLYEAKVQGDCGEEGLSSETELITFTTDVACPAPTSVTFSNITTTSVTVSWTGFNESYNLRYTDGAVENTIENVESPYTFDDILVDATPYTLYVEGICNDESVMSEGFSFTTKCNPVTEFPWSENFEDIEASSTGVTLSEPCWENEHLAGTGSFFFEVYSGTNGNNSTNQLRLHDMSDGTMTKLMLPSMTLPSNNYQFTIDVYRSSSYTSKTGEGIRVFASADGEIEGATELAFIPRLYTVESGVIPAEETGDQWYTYSLPIGMSGTCYIILRGESQYGTATYMDNFAVEEIPAPVCSITLDDNNEWSQNFDNLTQSTEKWTGTTMGTEGDCWTWTRLVELPEGYLDTVPQIYYNSNFAHESNYSLRLHFRGVYAMPELDESIESVKDLKMSFYLRQSYSFYTLLVGVMTDPTDPETFVPVAHVDNGESTGVEYIEVSFANYQGEGRYIAFKNVRPTATEFDGNWADIHSVNYIDNLTLSLRNEGECVVGLPYVMSFEEVTPSTNTLTGAMPDCWEMVQNDLDEEIPFDKMPQVYRKATLANSGDYSLRMADRCVYAMPQLADTVDMSRVQLSMSVRQPNVRYQLYVGVWAEGEFYPVALVNNASTSHELFECDFSNYDGPAGRIAFRNVLSSGKALDYSYNYLDDIEVSYMGEAPACDAVTSLNVTESFENYTNSTVAATGVKPTCWEVVAKDVEMGYDKYPQVYYNPNFGQGSYTLRMADRCVFAMPELEDGIELGDVTLTMTLRQPNTQYQLEVGVWEVGYDENQEPIEQFVPVATFHNADNTVTEVSCDFSSYTGNGNRIAFHNTLKSGNYNYSYNYIDDITLTLTETKIAESSSANVIDEMGVERYLESIAIYPNPTVGELHIGAVDVQKVECYNQMGQLVAVYNNDRDINISALADGVYTLRITVPQGVTMRKVVKR